ncbi:unnamed protein product [Rotaria socialis]|uniref:Uncharacterized protein n=1 Tax=Rotaria socialis TaxID=392032 RepID=A0A818JWE7_9BILA|nr:unnamed protein product [Rotaria socialis]CAF4822460.1 unnamed protein product [Rotaria socialis]
MGCGCCKETKIVDATWAVVQTQNVAATEIPYGYVFIYPGKPKFKKAAVRLRIRYQWKSLNVLQFTDFVGTDFSFYLFGPSLLRTKTAHSNTLRLAARYYILREEIFGYMSIFLGVSKSNETYTCPMLSIHTYRQSSEKTAVGYAEAQFSNKKKFDEKVGPLVTSKEEHLSSDETTIMIPVEDIINIYYTSGIKKSVKAQEHSRLVPVVEENGCCGCCGCCKKAPKPKRQIDIIEEKSAERVITVHIQYSKYSNLDTVSNARILSESDRLQFYKNQFQPNTELKFYLVRNAEYDSVNFNEKRVQAENLCRIIMQLKGINGGGAVSSERLHPKEGEVLPAAAATISYPSPQDLQQILNQSYYGIFGDVHQERLHSIETKQDFGTHVPVPTTTTVLASIEARPTDKKAAKAID